MSFKKLILVAAVVASSTTMQIVSAQDTLFQGRVEQRNSLKRVTRPAMPSKPVGEALEHVSNSVKKKTGADTKLAATSLTAMLDKGSFDTFAKTLQGTADGADKELVVAWEHWHKNLCSVIYQRWIDCGNIPGDASIDIHITRGGDVDFQLKDYSVNPTEQFSTNQKEMFEHAVGRTLQLVDPIALSFPARSQRNEVNLTTKFTYSDREDGPQGYTWKRDDVERVPSPR